MTNRTKIHLFLIVLILGFLTGPRVISALNRLAQDTPDAAQALRAQVASIEHPNTPILEVPPTNPYDGLNLEAKAVYIWDINDHKKLYGKNEYAALPLASLTKMMMALIAAETLAPDAPVTIRPQDLLADGDTGLAVGETWTLEDLLRFTLVVSSNDGASAIASVAGAHLAQSTTTDILTKKRLFIDRMNEKARTIGLSSTKFYNESGLDLESLASGAHGSARDMAMLFEYIFRKHPDLFTATDLSHSTFQSDALVHHVANTNQSVKYWSGMIGSKTGYTTLAGGNLVVVVDIGIAHPVVIAVLGSTYDGRFQDVETLLEATTKYLATPSTTTP